MPKETIINGKNHRWYRLGGLWVSRDGTSAYQPGKTAQTKKKLTIKSDYRGKYVIDKWGHHIPIAGAVITCYCPPKPSDGKRYVIGYRDDNQENCDYRNLHWTEYHYKHNTSNTAKLYKFGNVITVKKDGSVWKGRENLSPADYIFDPDVELFDCISPYIVVDERHRLYLRDLMSLAGFVNGDDAGLKNPVILHRDNDWRNYSSDNLEWVEDTDQRYIDYQEQRKLDMHNYRLELNPYKTLYPGW